MDKAARNRKAPGGNARRVCLAFALVFGLVAVSLRFFGAPPELAWAAGGMGLLYAAVGLFAPLRYCGYLLLWNTAAQDMVDP